MMDREMPTESRGAGHWDSHENNFGMLKSFNLPNLDQIGTALVDDLDRRRLLGRREFPEARGGRG